MKTKTKKYSTKKIKSNAVQEPLVAYNVIANSSNNFENIKHILSLTKNLTSELDIISLSRSGLNKSNLVSLSKFLGISMEKMSELLNLSSRTLQRKTNTESLNITTSVQAIELAEFTALGIQVLGSIDNYNKWLNTSLISIGNIAPINLLDTTHGIKILTKILGRIEHGIYS